jgi:hypothetical protein
VCLVDDEDRVGIEIGLRQEFTQKHAVCHVLEHGTLSRAILEADAVANLRVKDRTVWYST